MHCTPYSHPRLHRVSVTHSEDSRLSVRARHGYAYCRSKTRRLTPPPSSRRQHRSPCNRSLRNPHASRLYPKVRGALSFYNLLRFQPSEVDSRLCSQFMHNDFFQFLPETIAKIRFNLLRGLVPTCPHFVSPGINFLRLTVHSLLSIKDLFISYPTFILFMTTGFPPPINFLPLGFPPLDTP